jgi:hypothetical protein
MTPRRIDTEIDRLYQLPPDEFTAARNALAKDTGTDGADVRRLAKPPIAAWAINQVYWKRRDIYDALISASNELRKLHKAILSGRRADIREPAKGHDEAIDAALKAALGILGEEGHAVTDATRQAILTTLRALPGDDPPGRLTRTLQPGGFEMLAGLSIASPKSGGGARSFSPKAEATKAEATKAEAGTRAKAPPAAKARTDPKAAAQAKAAHEAAARAVRDAEQASSRAEFEAARLTREAAKAAKEVEEAREALETAQQALEDAKATAATTARARESADRRAKEAERALDAARRVFKDGGRS